MAETESVSALEKSKLFVDEDMSEAEFYSLSSGVAGVFVARSPGRTTPNEDAAALIQYGKDCTMLIVADGAGGARGGDKASALAVKKMLSSLEKGVKEKSESRTAIINGFESANEAVNNLGLGAATTLAVVEVQKQTIRHYHAGDSLILAVSNHGNTKLQNVAHSPVGYAVESGLIDEKEAMTHEDRHIVSNMIGSEDMHISIGSPIELAARDTVLVASDGLSDNLSIDEIVERVRSGSLSESLQVLAIDCTERMHNDSGKTPSKPDDLTVIAFRFN